MSTKDWVYSVLLIFVSPTTNLFCVIKPSLSQYFRSVSYQGWTYWKKFVKVPQFWFKRASGLWQLSKILERFTTAVMAGPINHFFEDFMVFTCQKLVCYGLKLAFFASITVDVKLNHFHNHICWRIKPENYNISQIINSHFVVFDSSRRASKYC